MPSGQSTSPCSASANAAMSGAIDVDPLPLPLHLSAQSLHATSATGNIRRFRSARAKDCGQSAQCPACRQRRTGQPGHGQAVVHSGSADHAGSGQPLPAHLELGFHHEQQVAARPGGQPPAGHDHGQGDEGQVGDGEVHRCRQCPPASCSGCSCLRRPGLGDHRAGRRPAGRAHVHAATWAAPRRSSTSVKPPVEAPASRQRLPAGDLGEMRQRAREFVAGTADVVRPPSSGNLKRLIRLTGGAALVSTVLPPR